MTPTEIERLWSGWWWRRNRMTDVLAAAVAWLLLPWSDKDSDPQRIADNIKAGIRGYSRDPDEEEVERQHGEG